MSDVILCELDRVQPEGERDVGSNQGSHTEQPPIHENMETAGVPSAPRATSGFEELEDCLEDLDVDLPEPAAIPEISDVEGGRLCQGRLRRLVREDAAPTLRVNGDHPAPRKLPAKNRITVKQVALPDGELDDDLGLPHDSDDDGDEQKLHGDSTGGGRQYTERMAADDNDVVSEEEGEGEEYWDEEDEYVEQLLNAGKGAQIRNGETKGLGF